MDKRSEFDNRFSRSSIMIGTAQGAKTLARAAKYLLIALPLLTTQVFAGPVQWQGGTSDDWATGANWDTGLAPVAADDVIFSGNPAALTNPNPISSATAPTSGRFNSLNFDGASGSFTINNNVGDMNLVGISNTSGWLQTINNNGNAILNISGLITGDNLAINNESRIDFINVGGTSAPTSNLVINNTNPIARVVFNTNSGPVGFSGDINGGILQKSNRDGELILTGNVNVDQVQISTNGGFLFVGDGSTNGSLQGDVYIGPGNAGIIFNSANDITFANEVNGFGSLTQRGSGILTLTADNAYGNTVIESGSTLRLGDGTSTSGSVTGNIYNDGTLIFDHNGTFIYNNRIFNSGSVIKNGSNTLVLTGNNGYSGLTTINGGILQLGDGGTSGQVTGDIDNDGTLVYDRSNNFNYTSVMSGNGALEKWGAGQLALAAVNTYTGLTTVHEGDLRIGQEGNLLNSNIANDAQVSFYLHAAADKTYPGMISGTGTIYKEGNSTIIFTGDHTYSGLTNIQNGKIQLGDRIGDDGLSGSIVGDVNLINTVSGLGFSRSNNVVYSGLISGQGQVTQDSDPGTVLTLLANNTNTGNLNILSGTVSLGNGGVQGSYAGNIVNDDTLIFNRSDNIVFGRNINGLGMTHKDGAGTLTLLGTIANAGGVFVDNGTLQISNGATSTGWVSGNIDLAAGTTVIFNRPDEVTYSDIISGAGNLEQSGPGALIFTTNQTYTGTTTVNGGVLQLGDNSFEGSMQGDIVNHGEVGFYRRNTVIYGGVISGDGLLRKRGGETLLLTGHNTYTGDTLVEQGRLQLGDGVVSGSLASDKVVLIGPATFLTFDNADDITYNGEIEGLGQLEKFGNGTVILNGEHSYVGNTTITEGGLLVGGSADYSHALIAGNVTVNPNGLLGGYGQISGNVNNRGTIAPGASHGTLTILGNYTQSGSGTYVADIHGAESDLLDVSGSVSLAGTLQLHVDTLAGFVPGQTYTLISSGEGISGNFGNIEGTDQLNQHFLTADVYVDDEANAVHLRPALNQEAIESVLQTANQRNFFNYLQQNHNPTLVGMIANATTAEELLGTFEQANPVSYANQQYQISQVGRWFESNVMDRMALYPHCQAVSAKDSGCRAHPSLWVTPYGSTATLDGDENAPNLDTTLGGATIGADFPVMQGAARVGLALGATYFDSDSSDNSNASASGTLYQFGVYGNYHANNWNLSASVTVGDTDNIDASRDVTYIDDTTMESVSTSMNGSYSASVFSQQLRASYDLMMKQASIKPFVGLVNQHISRDAFNESGQLDNLLVSVNEQNFDSLRSQLGASVSMPLKSVTLMASAAWQHEFSDTQGEISATMTEDGNVTPYTGYGVEVGRDSALVEAGLVLLDKGKMSLSVLYQGNFADSYTENGGKVQLDFDLS